MKMYDQDFLELFALLKEMEWVGRDFTSDPICPMCAAVEATKHDDDCELDRWLKKLRYV